MKVLKIVLMSICLIQFLSTTAFSESKGRKGRGMRSGDKMKAELNLTEEQQKQLKVMREAHKGKVKPLREKKREARKSLMEGFKNDSALEELSRLHKELQTARNSLSDTIFNHMIEVRKILTPEQRKKFHAFKQDRKGKIRKGRKGPRGRGPHRGGMEGEDDIMGSMDDL